MTLKDNNDGTFSIVAPCSLEKKELTNEEIVAIYKEVFGWDVKTSDRNWIGLARALIKKAMEK